MTLDKKLVAINQHIYQTVLTLCLPTTQAASGHAIRQQLLSEGYDKRTIATTLGELVMQGQLQRVRINEADGKFYLAYRPT